MGEDDRTDRYRPVFEPEDIFDRFVKKANASTEAKLPSDDEPTGVVDEAEVRARHKSREAALARRSAAAPIPDRSEPDSGQRAVGPGDPITQPRVDRDSVPSEHLESVLSDMAVLRRYGHGGQVRDILERLRCAYPEDRGLLRRIVKFHLAQGDRPSALEALLALARGHLERRNVDGAREALAQALALDPDSRPAQRLLAMLDRGRSGRRE